MGKRGGGIAELGHQGKPAEDGNVGTLPGVARAIFLALGQDGHLPPALNILDACSGRTGVLGHAAAAAVNAYTGRIPDIQLQDILLSGKPLWEEIPVGTLKWDLLVANPPWSTDTALAVWKHLVSCMHNTSTLVFLVNCPFFYQGFRRARELTAHAWYFLPRYVFCGSGRPLLDCGVAVLHGKDVRVPPPSGRIFIDIPKEVCRGEAH